VDPVARRADVVKELAFLLERGLARRVKTELEHRVRAYEFEKTAAYVRVGAADIANAEPSLRIDMAERVHPGRFPRHCLIYRIE
jgi:hypothetical protein